MSDPRELLSGVMTVDRTTAGVGEEPPPLRPSARDALWLVLCVVNAGLLLWLLPDKVLKSNWLDLLSGKIAPWFATSVFVAGYTWFRDEMLSISRSRAFRVAQVPLLLCLSILEVPLVVVRAELAPTDAELTIDGEPAGRTMADWYGSSYEHEIRLLLRPHRLELKRPAYWPPSLDVGTQSIELSWRDVFDALVHHRDFHWSLAWPVTVTFPICPPKRIIAVRTSPGGFDTNYLTTYARGEEIRPVADAAPYQPLRWRDGGTYRAVEIPVPEDRSSNALVHLPAGKFTFIAVRAKEEQKTVTISQRQPAVVVQLSQCS